MSTASRLIAKGEAKGEIRGRASIVLRQLAKKFGAVSPRIEARVRAGAAHDLERWADRLLTARSLADVFAAE